MMPAGGGQPALLPLPQQPDDEETNAGEGRCQQSVGELCAHDIDDARSWMPSSGPKRRCTIRKGRSTLHGRRPSWRRRWPGCRCSTSPGSGRGAGHALLNPAGVFPGNRFLNKSHLANASRETRPPARVVAGRALDRRRRHCSGRVGKVGPPTTAFPKVPPRFRPNRRESPAGALSCRHFPERPAPVPGSRR